MTNIFVALDAITQAVLSYRPAENGQAAAAIDLRKKDAGTYENKDDEHKRKPRM